MSASTRIERRRVLQAGAWSVPVVTVAAAAPRLAASTNLRTVTGTLTWGVKQSFRSYVITMPISAGTVALSGGVTRVDPADEMSPFIWPAGSGTVGEDGAIHVQFTGSVNFEKHEGQLDVTISDPLLTVSPDGAGTISVTHASPEGSSTLVLADLSGVTVTDDTSSVSADNGDLNADVPRTTLAETGVPVFVAVIGGTESQFYNAGDPMNGFSTTLTVG